MTLNTLGPSDQLVNEEMVEMLLKHCHNGHNEDDIMCIESTNSEPIYHVESFTRFDFILKIDGAVSAAFRRHGCLNIVITAMTRMT